MTDREHWAQSTGEPEPGAPPGVRPISLDALNHLGVDGEGNLYWLDTKILTTKKEFRLSFFQATVAVVTALSAAATAMATVYMAYMDRPDTVAEIAPKPVAFATCKPPVGSILMSDAPVEGTDSVTLETENCLADNAYRFAATNLAFDDALGAVIGACKWEISNNIRERNTTENDWRERAKFRLAEARTGKCVADEDTK